MRESLSVGQVDVMTVGKIISLTAGHARASGDASWTGAEALTARVSRGSSETTKRSLRAEGLGLGISCASSEAAWTAVLVVCVGVGKGRALSVGTTAESAEESIISHPAKTSN